MSNNNSNYVNPKTGTTVYDGPSELTKGNHYGMPPRTDAYLSTDDRGHVQGSAVGGSNNPDNIVPQASDLNRAGGAYYAMEQGEREALRNGSSIHSEKIAYVSNQPGGRPDAFMVNDTIQTSDGQTQSVHLSFSNLTNAEQEAMNAETAAQASDMLDSQPNPGDGLRASMSAEEYAALMEETDAALPNVADHYAVWDYEGPANTGVESTEVVAAEADADPGADVDPGDDGAGISSDDDD